MIFEANVGLCLSYFGMENEGINGIMSEFSMLVAAIADFSSHFRHLRRKLLFMKKKCFIFRNVLGLEKQTKYI